MKQRAVPAGKFKNLCLKLMDEVHEGGTPIVVTKRGKPIVQVIPFRPEKPARSLVGTIVHEADDIFSTGETWEAES